MGVLVVVLGFGMVFLMILYGLFGLLLLSTTINLSSLSGLLLLSSSVGSSHVYYIIMDLGFEIN